MAPFSPAGVLCAGATPRGDAVECNVTVDEASPAPPANYTRLRLSLALPQAAGDSRSGTGCWNWVNYDLDEHFDDQRGVVLRTIVAMVEALPTALAGSLVSEGDAIPAEVLREHAVPVGEARSPRPSRADHARLI